MYYLAFLMGCVTQGSWAHYPPTKLSTGKNIIFVLPASCVLCLVSEFSWRKERPRCPDWQRNLPRSSSHTSMWVSWVGLQVIKITAYPSHSLRHEFTKTPTEAGRQTYSENQAAHGPRLMELLVKQRSSNCVMLKQRVESIHLGEENWKEEHYIPV